MKKIVLALLFLGVGSAALYGLGYPPFGKEKAPEQRSRRSRDRALTVEVGEIQLGTIEEGISAVGSLLPSRSVNLAPRINGRVENVLVDVGDRVNVGQLIARLDEREIAEQVREAEAALQVSEANLNGKQAQLEDLERKLKRSKTLFSKNFISRQEMETLGSEVAAAASQVELTKAQILQMKASLANARLQLQECRVVAPFAGFVEKRFVDPGALVNGGTPIVSIVDISPVKVMISVVEKEYPRISPGQAAKLTFEAYPGRPFKGRVVRKTPVLNQDTRTGEVEIEVDNSSATLKPGMTAKVSVVFHQRNNALLVPAGALVKTGEGHGVFRVSSGGSKNAKAEFVPVKTGSTRDGQIEVDGELQVGQKVVTLGGNLLKDGQRIRFGNRKGRAEKDGGDQ